MIPLKDDNPTRRTPYVTVTLIVACVLVFLWQLSFPPDAQRELVYALGAIPAVLFELRELPVGLSLIPAEASIVTSMFLHGGWLHLLGNMLYLWIFGNNIEDAMGHFRFILFYLVCGTIGVMAQALPDPTNTLPIIGASGAIAGILGAYLLLYPRKRVLVAIPIFVYVHFTRVPAAWVLGFWILLQVVQTLFSDPGQSGVAWGAHIGGFVAGMALIPLFRDRNVPLLQR